MSNPNYSKVPDTENQIEFIESENPYYNVPFESSNPPSAPSYIVPPQQQQYLPQGQPYYEYQSINDAHKTTGYQSIPSGYFVIRSRENNSRHFPYNATMFLLGFIIPGLWCISCSCGPQHNPYERWWRKWNVAMAWISSIFVLFCMVLVIFLLLDSKLQEPEDGGLPQM